MSEGSKIVITDIGGLEWDHVLGIGFSTGGKIIICKNTCYQQVFNNRCQLYSHEIRVMDCLQKFKSQRKNE